VLDVAFGPASSLRPVASVVNSRPVPGRSRFLPDLQSSIRLGHLSLPV